MPDVDGLLMICPVVTTSLAERAVPPQVTLVRDAPFMDSLEPAQRELFGSFAVVQTQRTWERTRDEVGDEYVPIAGLELADRDFLSRLQSLGYAFSFDVGGSPAASSSSSWRRWPRPQGVRPRATGQRPSTGHARRRPSPS